MGGEIYTGMFSCLGGGQSSFLFCGEHVEHFKRLFAPWLRVDKIVTTQAYECQRLKFLFYIKEKHWSKYLKALNSMVMADETLTKLSLKTAIHCSTNTVWLLKFTSKSITNSYFH